jgi:hypothetical protein
MNTFNESKKGKTVDEQRLKTGQALIDAAYKFWEACHKEGQYGAVQWLEGTNGELIIFTRSEYRDRLMWNIPTLPNADKIHMFGESMPEEVDE